MLQRLVTLKTLVCLSVISAVVLTLLLFPLLRSDNIDGGPSHSQDEHWESRRWTFLVDTPGCKIPNVDPFDSTIRHLVNADNISVVCNATPPMTFTNGTWLRINSTALSLYYNDELDYCEYQAIERPPPPADGIRHNDGGPTTDNRFSYRRAVQFHEDIDLSRVAAEFVRVACYGRRYGSLLYTNFHAVILLKYDVERRCRRALKHFVADKRPTDLFNYLVLGVDSVSRLNFARHMPRTRRFLLEELDAVELTGFNKVADNTYVNLVPMFAGRYVEELPWDERFSDIPFDNYTFVWNELSSRGYRTLYAEDAPSIAIFNYNKAGFHRPPADYYLRPFSLAMEDHGAMWNTGHDCVGARLETDVVLDWIVEFEQRFRDVPHASFNFITRLTHEDVRKAAVADRPYERFLRRLYDGGLLNHTVLILYSDHGIRFGDLRRTYVGKLEERLPFVVVRLPPRLHKAYRRLSNALTVNAGRLTTPFDIYETLADLKDFDGSVRHGCSDNMLTRGCSLLAEVPSRRTCEDAGVLPHWCACHETDPIDPADPAVQRAADAVVWYINDALSVYRGLCAQLRLLGDSVIDARRVRPRDDVIRFRNSRRDVLGRTVEFDSDVVAAKNRVVEYQLTLETTPGGAVFEATVRCRGDTSVQIADISRINAYGDQSACIDVHSHKKFCYCV